MTWILFKKWRKNPNLIRKSHYLSRKGNINLLNVCNQVRKFLTDITKKRPRKNHVMIRWSKQQQRDLSKLASVVKKKPKSITGTSPSLTEPSVLWGPIKSQRLISLPENCCKNCWLEKKNTKVCFSVCHRI